MYKIQTSQLVNTFLLGGLHNRQVLCGWPPICDRAALVSGFPLGNLNIVQLVKCSLELLFLSKVS